MLRVNLVNAHMREKERGTGRSGYGQYVDVSVNEAGQQRKGTSKPRPADKSLEDMAGLEGDWGDGELWLWLKQHASAMSWRGAKSQEGMKTRQSGLPELTRLPLGMTIQVFCLNQGCPSPRQRAKCLHCSAGDMFSLALPSRRPPKRVSRLVSRYTKNPHRRSS